MIGNAFRGSSDLLVVEADESDGTIVKYHTDVAVVLNVSKDHRSVEEIKEFFSTLISKAKWAVTNSDDSILASLPASERFGRNLLASWRPDQEELLPM